MSKQRQQEEGEGPRCPMCRLPLLVASTDGSVERTVKIHRKWMTEIMNKYGGCGSKFFNPQTNRQEAPELRKGQSYASHPDTRATVEIACKSQGPHHCQRHACSIPFCNNSVTPKGCHCGSLKWDEKQRCWDAISCMKREQQASCADKRAKVSGDGEQQASGAGKRRKLSGDGEQQASGADKSPKVKDDEPVEVVEISDSD